MKFAIPHWKLIALTIGVFLCIITCTTKTANNSDSKYLNHNDSVEYVGIQACRPCHSEIYDSFMHTGMGQSFHVASKDKSIANFENVKPVYDPNLNMYYYPFWESDTLYFREYRLNGSDTTHNLVKQIHYIIGSGQHTNSHLYVENGYLYQAPLTWYSQKRKWDLPPGFENGNSRFSRKLDEECISCHNAMPEYVVNSGNRFLDIPHGIDCERCHGPGEAHIAKVKSGDITDTANAIDYSIVNPSKLSWEFQMDVCQRCHLQGNSVLKPEKRFIDFRPGMRLNEFYEVFLPEYEGDHSFIMASHAERLQSSQCFIKSNVNNSENTLTCINCHNPHISVKSTSSETFNTTCKSCHFDEGKLCTESKEELKLQNNNCVSCHMQKSGASDIPHVAIHDHKISIPGNTNSDTEDGNIIGLKSLNNKNSSNLIKLIAYISYYEKSGNNPIYIEKAKGLLNNGNDEVKIHYFYNTGQNSEIIKLAKKLIPSKVSDPWTYLRIASAYNKSKQWSNSEYWLDSLSVLAPYNLDFNNERAKVKMRLKKLNEALTILTTLFKLQPSYESTLVNLGRVYFLKNNLGLAKRYSLLALKVNPDSRESLSTLKDIYIATSDETALSEVNKKLIQIQN